MKELTPRWHGWKRPSVSTTESEVTRGESTFMAFSVATPSSRYAHLGLPTPALRHGVNSSRSRSCGHSCFGSTTPRRGSSMSRTESAIELDCGVRRLKWRSHAARDSTATSRCSQQCTYTSLTRSHTRTRSYNNGLYPGAIALRRLIALPQDIIFYFSNVTRLMSSGSVF